MHWPHLRLPFFRRHTAPPAPPVSTPQPTTRPPVTTTPAPVGHSAGDGFDGPLRVNVARRIGFTAAESAKLDKAIVILGQVMNSPEFKEQILNYAEYQGGFANADGLTRQQIFDKIMAGAEQLSPTADNEMDLDMEIRNLGWFQRNVVGYTTEDTSVITSNRRFFSNYTPAEIAGNLAHEWMHKLGFDHDFKSTARRPYSVPYAVGDMVEALAEKYEH